MHGDFELAIKNAFIIVFGLLVKFAGCYFHFVVFINLIFKKIIKNKF